MAITIGTLTLQNLTAQPFGYNEIDLSRGLTARRWSVEGLLRPAEWLDLLGVFETWQANRFNDPDTLTSLAVGTTISFSGSIYGQSWTDVPCWFSSAPSGSATGAYIAASFELVDAEQSLAALLRGLEMEQEASDSEESHGTFDLGGTTLTLLEQPDGYAEGPTLDRMASGAFRVSGVMGAVRSKALRGYTNDAGWSAIRSWYETTAQASPTTGGYYPVSPPSMQREAVILNGVKTSRCVVSIELWEV